MAAANELPGAPTTRADVTEKYTDQLMQKVQAPSSGRELFNAWTDVYKGLSCWVENADATVFASATELDKAAWEHVSNHRDTYADFHKLEEPVRQRIRTGLKDCAHLAFGDKQPATGIIVFPKRDSEVLQGIDYVKVVVDGISPPAWSDVDANNGLTRRLCGTLVLGPSGSGKTVFMIKGVAAELIAATTFLTGHERDVVTIYAKLTDLEGCANGADADTLKTGVAAMLRSLTTQHSFKDKYVVICIDEIGLSPGVLSQRSTWDDLALQSHTALANQDVNAKAVHIVAGGTAAELKSQALASDCDTVRKVRLPQWSLKQVLSLRRATEGNDPEMLKHVIETLCALSPGLCAAVTNPRMAGLLLGILHEGEFLKRAEVNGTPKTVDVEYLIAQQSWLVREVVRLYVDMNGLRSLVHVSTNDDAIRALARGVAVGALWACMRQRTHDVQNRRVSRTAAPASSATPASATTAAPQDAGPRSVILEEACAHAAEHFGLLTSNWKSDDTVEPGRLQYEMHAGMVLVAAHLAGLNVAELSPTWWELEELTGLALLVEAIGETALVECGPLSEKQQTAVPTALRRDGIVLPSVVGPIRNPLHWDNKTAPQRTSSANGEWCMWMPTAPTSIIAKPKASMPDAFGYRILAQCKFTDPGRTDVTRADITNEVRKGGLLQDSTHEQQRVLDVMMGWWETACFGTQGVRRRVSDFAVAQSTIGARHMYPLNLLMGPLPSVHPAHQLCQWVASPASVRAREADFTTVAPPVHGKTAVPSPVVQIDRTRATTVQHDHKNWCEFRFVVTDLRTCCNAPARKRSGEQSKWEQSRTLAVYERTPHADLMEQKKQTWSLVETRDQKHPAANLAATLRTDSPLSLIAITVCHVCQTLDSLMLPRGDGDGHAATSTRTPDSGEPAARKRGVETRPTHDQGITRTKMTRSESR